MYRNGRSQGLKPQANRKQSDPKVRASMPMYQDDQGNIARTWLVEPGQALQITNLADGLGVSHSALVRYLLRFVLGEIDAGRLELRTRPARYELVED